MSLEVRETGLELVRLLGLSVIIGQFIVDFGQLECCFDNDLACFKTCNVVKNVVSVVKESASQEAASVNRQGKPGAG